MSTDSRRLAVLFDYAITSRLASRSGSLVHAQHLATHLSRQVDLFGVAFHDQPALINQESGVRHCSRWFSPRLPKVVNNLWQLTCLVLRRQPIDVVYVRYVYTFCQLGLLYALLLGKPLIFELGGIPWEEETGFKYGPRIRRWYLWCFRRARLIIAYSASIRDTIVAELDLPAASVTVIPCGVDDTVFRVATSPDAPGREQQSGACYTVCYVGSIDRWQGLDILVEAAALLAAAGVADLRFVIVGEGRELPALRNLVRERGLDQTISFVGAVPQTEVPAYLAAADVCIAPFRKGRKASPLKVLEYLAAGKPVVAARVPDVVALDLEGISYFEPGNPTDLSDVVLSACRAEQRISPARLRAQVVDRFAWPTIASKIVEILDSIRGPARY